MSDDHMMKPLAASAGMAHKGTCLISREVAAQAVGLMPDSKPKLLIVGFSKARAQELCASLESRFDVLIDPPEKATASLEQGLAQIVLTTREELLANPAHPAAMLLNAIGEGVCLLGPDGHQVWANERFMDLPEVIHHKLRRCATQAREALGAVDARTIGHQASTASCVLKQVPLTASAICKFEVQDQLDSGPIFFEVYISRAQPAGSVKSNQTPADKAHEQSGAALAVVVRDVTSNRRMTQRLNAIDQAGAELVSLEAETVRTRNAVERIKLLEERIVKIAHDQLHFDHFVIRVLDTRTGKLEPVIAAGLAREAVGLELYAEETGNGISGLVAVTGQSVICHNVQEDERFMPGLGNAQSSLTVPLQLHDRVIGIINIESDQPDTFSEEDRQFCEIFARYIAIALHMLDLLVVEQSTTNLHVSDRVRNELTDCLEDIVTEAETLKNDIANKDEHACEHISHIEDDVRRIRERLTNLTSGPQTLLGIDRALAVCEEDPVLKGKRILVADDESKIRRIIRDVLRTRGCSVDIYESGNAAIAQLERCKTENIPAYDLIISDINMPDRNGYEVFNAANQILPGVPVILMTGFGYDPHHSIVRASQEGLQSVLFKPFQIERLIEDARKALSVDSSHSSD